MKKKGLLYLLFSLFISACSSVKKTVKKPIKTNSSISSKIIKEAKSYQGVRYKYGGTTRKGMDCSGLVYVAFLENKVKLPRVSRFMAKEGKPISVSKITKGDLLFFKTNKSKNQINHVGLVTSVFKNKIEFIHSTTSKGVIISSLSERYWKNAFVLAKRVL